MSSNAPSKKIPFNERLNAIVGRHISQFDVKNGGKEHRKMLQSDINSVHRQVVRLIVGIVVGFLVCLASVGITLVQLACWLIGTLRNSPSAPISLYVFTFAAASVLMEIYMFERYKESIAELDRLYAKLDECLRDSRIEMTPHSVHLFIACILSSCSEPEDEPIYEATLPLKTAEDRLELNRQRFDAIVKINDVGESASRLLETTEWLVAANLHRAINVLVGVGADKFVQEAAPAAANACNESISSLEDTLKRLAASIDCDKQP